MGLRVCVLGVVKVDTGARDHGVAASVGSRRRTGREVRQVVGELEVHLPRRAVLDGVLENRAGNARVQIVTGDEGAEARNVDLEGHIRVGQRDGAEGVFAFEGGTPKPGKAFVSAGTVPLALEPEAVNLLFGEGTLHEPGDRVLALDVEEGEGGILGDVSIVHGRGLGPVSYGEVLEAAVAVQANAAGAETAQRHGDLDRVRAGVGALGGGALEERAGVGLSFGRHGGPQESGVGSRV